ncbi:MAG: VCBS repeat-containing protein [Saprospiraceae bacterium]|nr:VCBS repeat-containing protein [Saprospiraceae bacterium]
MKFSLFTKCPFKKYLCQTLPFFALCCYSHSAFTQDEYILTGDTLMFELKDTSGYRIQWQIRGDSFSRWRNIQGATMNSYKFVLPDSLEGVVNFRAKIMFPLDTCSVYSTEVTKIVGKKNSQVNIGDRIGGGFVFYSNTEFALVASPFGLGRAQWGCSGKRISGATGKEIGDGLKNTKEILNQCLEPNIAAFHCDTFNYGGYDDWFLPSNEELRLLVSNLNGKYNFKLLNYNYWSSTEKSENDAWYLYHPDTTFYYSQKNHPWNYIHPIRKNNNSTQNLINIAFYKNEFNPIHILTEINSNDSSVIDVHYIGDSEISGQFKWNFGNTSKIISGANHGPYKIAYFYGGYIRINLEYQGNSCNRIEYSDFFRPLLFKENWFNTIDIQEGDMQWGDFNNDGFIDMIITGSNTTTVHKNIGNGKFLSINSNLPGLINSSCDWGDINNDGFLDIAVSGYSEINKSKITKLYLNDQNSNFLELPLILPSVDSGFIKFVDLNNDGKIEIIVSGSDLDNKPLSEVFSINKTNEIQKYSYQIDSLKYSSVSIGDYDNNGFNDLIVTGNNGISRKTIIFNNNEGKLFNISSPIKNVDNGYAAWGDFDNDGFLDIALQGLQKDVYYLYDGPNLRAIHTDGSNITWFYKNENNNSFAEKLQLSAYLRYSYGRINCGDYDNDGNIDIAISGVPGFQVGIIGNGLDKFILPGNPRILRNFGNFAFGSIQANIPSFLTGTDNLETTSSQFYSKDINFGDINNDGKLDLYRDGYGEHNTALYINNLYTKNFQPSIPMSLNAIPYCNNAIISWSNSIDDHTPTQCITYEIYVGTAPGKCDVFSKVNSYKIRNNTFELNNLQPGTYYWSVKAVDQAQTASAWAPEQSFTISGKPSTPVVTIIGNTLHSSVQSGNQWHDLNGPISGATAQEYIPTLNGTYYSLVTDHLCTSDTSNKVEVIVTGITNSSGHSAFNIMPNPANKYLNVSSPFASQNVSYKITDIHGREILAGFFHGKIAIQIESLSNGTYFLNLTCEKLQEVHKFIKQ